MYNSKYKANIRSVIFIKKNLFEEMLEMISKWRQLRISSAIVICFVGFYCFPASAENIIQQKTMSFETCLKVIKSSEDQLAITSQKTDESKQRRIALFKLVDGTLKIICDGDANTITVSTQTN